MYMCPLYTVHCTVVHIKSERAHWGGGGAAAKSGWESRSACTLLSNIYILKAFKTIILPNQFSFLLLSLL